MLIIKDELMKEWIEQSLTEVDLTENTSVLIKQIEDDDYAIEIVESEDDEKSLVEDGWMMLGLNEDEEFVVDGPEEILNEFKSSYGDPSSVPEPINVSAKKRKADKENDGDKAIPQDPKGKQKVIAGVVKKIKEMNIEDINAVYKQLTEDPAEYDNLEDHVEKDYKITPEDINIQDDIEAIFSGDDTLTEEFKTKATTIFEAAVVSKVNEVIEKITLENEAEMESVQEAVVEQMENNLNEYMDYVIDEWMNENELAVNNGIRSEIAENFLAGMKTLFEESYIEVPEEKIDIVEEVTAHAESIQESLDEEISKNAELHAKVKEYEKERAFALVSEDLSDTEAEKLRSLSEGVEFTTEDDFSKNLETIKESYFSGERKVVQLNEVVIDDDSDGAIELDDTETEDNIPPSMRAYVNKISSSVPKS